jgi:endonuclease/exonuclease/phosphatase family metal-dependent hydrolase
VRVVCWNLHGCVGTDGRFDPERVARALVALRPDVALLQEVGDPAYVHPPVDQARVLAAALDMIPMMCLTMPHGHHGFGNLTLSRAPVLSSESYDLSVGGYEPRVCQCVTLDAGGARLRAMNLHLGLRRRERRKQLEILFHALGPVFDHPDDVPTVAGGDFNEWPPGLVTRTFETHFRDAACLATWRPPPTFPSRRPLLRLDRLYISHALSVELCSVVSTETTRAASDHLPLVVDLCALADAAAARALRRFAP